MDGKTQADAASTAAVGNGTRPANAMRNLSREMVRLYKEQFGRGPETASSHYVGPDMVICLLGHSLTPVELTMREMGEQQRLRDIRTMFQHATADKFRAAAEAVTGRKVIAFMSGTDIEQDLSCEVFTLAPESE